MEEIIAFAKQKHEGKFRRLSEVPYIFHPTRVAEILKAMNESDDIIKAAYLHDTVEDTDTTIEEISKKFGKKVANLVKELTSDRSAIKKIGKAPYLTNKMNNMSLEALTIKLADRLDNVSDLNASDIEFTQKYLKETQYILEHLKRKLNKNQQQLYNLILERVKQLEEFLK